METEDLQSLVGDLADNVDDLEAVLAPLTSKALATSTSKLPLLDKAKLYILATYSIESLLFSALRLSGVDAKTHPVFQELNRVKEYFAKVKLAETGPAKRTTALDKDAAGRFIKAGLSGNDRYDRERSERKDRERAGAKRRLEDMQGVGSHIRFDGTAKRIRASEEGERASNGLSESSQAPRSKQEKGRQRGPNLQAGDHRIESDGMPDEVNSAADKSVSRHGKSSHPPKGLIEVPITVATGTTTTMEGKKHKKKKRKN
nr:exosome complex protein [Quercus suber]